MSKMRVKL